MSDYSPYALVGAAAFAWLLWRVTPGGTHKQMYQGMMQSTRSTMPALPLLVCIAMVSATWMLSGVVPTLIRYGLMWLRPDFFLVITCVVCAVISVLTGSSWTTIATIGVAFMGIGEVMGFGHGWTAGAIISGAYFGDKMSPLSDTTIISSSTVGVELFDHIRNMMQTTGPTMIVSLLIFGIVGFTMGGDAETAGATGVIEGLQRTFNLTPWLLVVPVLTAILIAMRLNTLITLLAATAMGMTAMLIAQPHIVATLVGGIHGVTDLGRLFLYTLWNGTELSTGSASLDSLVSTGGIMGMSSTVLLIVCAIIFGGVMIGSGMLGTLADALVRMIKGRTPAVGTTAVSGLVLNACTADQYLAIIVAANLYRPMYDKLQLEPKLLSRTIEDGTSVTSVLIPWNTCGVAQASVLGVATLAYAPYCVFNYLSPLMSVLMALRHQRRHAYVRTQG